MNIFISSGELSGDEHTAPILEELKKINPNIKFFGMGADNLKKAGMDLIIDSSHEGSVMGLTEVLGHVRKLFKASKILINEVDIRKPKVSVLVDFPDFNLRMAKKLKKRGIKVIYFISPQLWAWRSGRIKQIKKYVDIVLPIFPFEEKFYQSHGVTAKYVGHPFLSRPEIELSKESLREEFGVKSGEKLIALLPGSRKSEVREILPNLIKVKDILAIRKDNLKFIIPVAPSVSSYVRDFFKDHNIDNNLILVEGRAREILKASDAGVVASGTATVETALSELPFCIVYKVSKLTYAIGRRLITGVQFVGMPNLICEKKIIKEFIQDDFTPEHIVDEIINLIDNNEYREQMIKDLKEVRSRLSSRDSSSVYKEVSKAILQLV